MTDPAANGKRVKRERIQADAVISPPGLSIQPVRNGLGIVATRPFKKGDTVCEVQGRVVTAGVVWRYWKSNPRRGENCFRFDEENYLDPMGYIGSYANHSCAPNAGIRKHSGRLWLVAVRRIAVGSEVTHDYSTLLGVDDIWTMECNCGESKCRGTVDTIATISHATFKYYSESGMIPGFIRQMKLRGKD